MEWVFHVIPHIFLDVFHLLFVKDFIYEFRQVFEIPFDLIPFATPVRSILDAESIRFILVC